MATEPGVSSALGLQFQSTMEDVVPPPLGREDPSWEGPCKTRPGHNSGDTEGPPRRNGDLPERSPALNPSSGNGQPLIPALWDNPRWLVASTERVAAYPGRKPASQLGPGPSQKAGPFSCPSDPEGGDTNGTPHPSEVQRLNFRHFSYPEAKRPGEVCSQLWYFCHRWLRPERHTKEQILELLILEQFLAILPPEMQGCVKRHHPKSCAQAVALAEGFLLQKEKELGKRGEQVVFEEVPENHLEAEPAPSEAGQEAILAEVKQETKVIADRVGDAPSTETEEVPCLGNGDVVEFGIIETGNSLPFSVGEGGEEEVPSGSERKPEEDTEEGLVGLGALSPLRESRPPQKVLGVKQETTCRVCGKSFSRRTGLLAHERVHTGEKPYRCSHCGRSFRSKSTLVVHQRTHTGEKPYPCRECGKSFPVTTQLIEHERTHSGEKPYPCAECGQAFRQRSHLKNHQKIHTGAKPFKCSYCGKGFSISSDLIRHERAHTGEKPFQCPDCGKRFCNSSQVITHRRVHTGEKPYKCLECGKGFAVSQQLIRHQAVHTGEKPYPCPECGKTFSASTLLAGHLRIHTGEKPYECPECGKRFRLRSTLIAHWKTHPARTT